MACSGVFFALDEAQTNHLLSLNSDRERLSYIVDEIEQAWDVEHLYQTYKAWDAIHRCLNNGILAAGDTPLSRLILGGKQLYSRDDYIVKFVESSELREIASALAAVSKDWMREQYEQLRDTDYPQEYISEQDWEYTWEYFSGIPDFVTRAESEGRSLVFTVDQ